MFPRNLFWPCLIFALCSPFVVNAQTMTNPDLSVIGDMRYAYRDDIAAALADRKNLAFQFEELEINVSGYLNPYARADVFVAVEGVSSAVDIEQAYATVLRGLPVQLRFGKYFLDFGKTNQMHRHQLASLEYPLQLRSFFGEEGARVIGLRVSRLQGIGDTVLELSVNACSSDFFEYGEEDSAAVEDHEHGEGGGPAKIAGAGRLALFREVGETSALNLGGSYVFATYDIENDLATHLAAVDLTYKWRPNQYKQFKFLAEAMLDKREVPVDSVTTSDVTAYGAFADAQLRFRRKYEVGTFFDWSQDAFDSNLEATSYGAYFGFMPVEETARFSVVYRHTESGAFEGHANSVILQVLWALGPHKPHPF